MFLKCFYFVRLTGFVRLTRCLFPFDKMAPLFEAEKKDMANDRYMKIGEVLERTSYSRAQIYRLMKSGEFPSAYRLSKSRVAWKESEVDAWVEERQSIFLVPQLDKGQKLLEEVWRR